MAGDAFVVSSCSTTCSPMRNLRSFVLLLDRLALPGAVRAAVHLLYHLVHADAPPDRRAPTRRTWYGGIGQRSPLGSGGGPLRRRRSGGPQPAQDRGGGRDEPPDAALPLRIQERAAARSGAGGRGSCPGPARHHRQVPAGPLGDRTRSMPECYRRCGSSWPTRRRGTSNGSSSPSTGGRCRATSRSGRSSASRSRAGWRRTRSSPPRKASRPTWPACTPARPGRGAGAVARPLGHGGPGRGRCLARGLRPALRGAWWESEPPRPIATPPTPRRTVSPRAS